MAEEKKRPPLGSDGVWWILDRIQNDLDRLDEKWDANIASMARVTENLATVSTKVQELNSLLVSNDRGSTSVVSQLNDVTSDVKDIKVLLSSLRESLDAVKSQVGVKTPKEVQIERLKTLGSAMGMLALVIPGILSFLRDYL